MRELVDDLRDAVIRDPNPWDVTLYERAADEIERLRVLGDRLVNAVHFLLDGAEPTEDLEGVLHAWEETRRG